MPFRMSRAGLAGTTLVVLATTTACGSDDASDTATSATTSAAASPTAPATSTSPSAVSLPSPPPADTIDVSYAGGQITGDTGRVKAALGDTITINVTSDVADEAHLHGYDISQPVTAGGTTTFTVEAKIPGVFQLELEGLGQRLLSLQVG